MIIHSSNISSFGFDAGNFFLLLYGRAGATYSMTEAGIHFTVLSTASKAPRRVWTIMSSLNGLRKKAADPLARAARMRPVRRKPR